MPDTVYTIQKGDTLSLIAKKFGFASWKEIWNYSKNEAFRNSHPDPNKIYVGETLVIPGSNPKKPSVPSGVPSTIQTKLIEVKSITFLNDHEKLVKNTTDWTKKGAEIKEPKWDLTHSDPVVVTMGSTLQCKIVFSVQGPSVLKIDGDFEGNGNWQFNTFAGHKIFQPKETTIDVTGQDTIPEIVSKFENCNIAWKVKGAKGEIDAGTAGPITFFSILGTPLIQNNPEDGLTTRRMEIAVEWVNACGTIVPVEIVEKLFDRYKVYTLGFDYLPQNLQDELAKDPLKKKALSDAGFAAYVNDKVGGAWPLAEFEKYGGECQAIVRLVRGILHQVGCPGIIELKYVNAVIDSSYIVKTKVLDVGTRVTGPDSKKGYALVDGAVSVGQFCTSADAGFNNYEAYMKYTYPVSGKNMAAWFGGGAGKFGEVDTGDPAAVSTFEESLINVFWGIVEYEAVLQGTVRKKKITWLEKF
jgi:LysM repeat protein